VVGKGEFAIFNASFGPFSLLLGCVPFTLSVVYAASLGAMDSGAFYDELVGRQVAVRVNERHRAILRWMERFGFREGQ